MIIVDRDPELRDWLQKKSDSYFDPTRSRFIGLESNGEIAAVTGFTDFNAVSCHMHIGIEGRLTREYTRFCFWYPFEQLGVKKVFGLVAANNAKALRFDKHLGFQEEARIKEALPSGDMIILSMTKEQCRFLDKSFYKQ